MVTKNYQPQTIDEFEVFIHLPENADKSFEFIGGKVVEVPSNPLSSKIAMLIGILIGAYLLKHDIGHLTGADGGYIVAGERYIPDVAFISYKKIKTLSYREGYVPIAPDLAVEVISPANSESDMTTKISNYLADGTVVWRVRPEEKQISVFIAGKKVQHFGVDDALDGGDILPDFSLPVVDIFPESSD